MVLHHQNQDVVDLRKGVRTFRLAGNGALPRAPPPSTTRLRSHGTRLPVLDTDIPRCRAPLNIQAGNNNPEQSLILAVTSDRPGTEPDARRPRPAKATRISPGNPVSRPVWPW